MNEFREALKKNRILIWWHLMIGMINAFLVNYKADCFQSIVDGLTQQSIGLKQILLYGVVLITNYCMSYADEYPSKKLEYGIFLDFKLLALRKISTVDYSAYLQMGTGKLVQRIESGAEAGKNILCDFWLRLIRQLIPTVIFSLVFIWKINRGIMLVLLAGYVVIFVITNILLKMLYRIKEKILTNEEQLNHFLIRGFMEMVVFRMERQFPNELRKADGARETIVAAKVKMNMIHEVFFTIFALLIALLDIGILVFAWSGSGVSVGSVVALISLIDHAYTPIAIFNVIYVQYKLDKSAYRRFQTFLNLTDDEQLERGRLPGELSGEISIQNLGFEYQNHTIFEDLCLSVSSGEKVAFVGESGSGKSTLGKLLAGLLKYKQGSIQLGKVELKETCLNQLYPRMAYLSQEAPVFDGTIRENLVFDEPVPDERLIEALERVQLIHLLDNGPDGLDAVIGERGTMLSGGEKQRLAVARLLLRNPCIVILDEATSAMDNLTEKVVMAAVLERFQHCTVIAIAHRLNTVANFDRIVVFRQGEIVGQGPFQELMEKNPYFEELYHASALGHG